ncbi:MAG: hypothetical protein ABSG76_23590 [Xanthobacteraceae bacterium]|jgi:hypothetical protein
MIADPAHPLVIVPTLPISTPLRRRGAGYSALSMRHGRNIYYRDHDFYRQLCRVERGITLRKTAARHAQFFACVESADCGKLVPFLLNGASRT